MRVLLHFLGENNVGQEVVHSSFAKAEAREDLGDTLQSVLEVDALKLLESKWNVWSTFDPCLVLNVRLIRPHQVFKSGEHVLIVEAFIVITKRGEGDHHIGVAEL
jgi:hypothetical protein